MIPGLRTQNLFIVLVTLLGTIYAQQIPARPIIGIVSIPSDVAGLPADYWSYFPSSYAKFVESGGAQVVPIPYDLPTQNITYLLDRLNGVFLTGGTADYLTPNGSQTLAATNLQFIVDYVIQANSNGTFYPLWGTCEGYELIACAMAGSFYIRSTCVGCKDINKNNFVNLMYNSKLLATIDEDLKEKMSYAQLSYFSQIHKFDTTVFEEGGALYQVLQPVTFTYDQSGTKYVSSFESPQFPIYGTQFHQEKSTFEWHSPMTYNHGYDSVMLQQYLSNFFVSETVKNNNTFPNYSDFLIDNNQAIVVPGYTSVYAFPTNTVLKTDYTAINFGRTLSTFGGFIIFSIFLF